MGFLTPNQELKTENERLRTENTTLAAAIEELTPVPPPLIEWKGGLTYSQFRQLLVKNDIEPFDIGDNMAMAGIYYYTTPEFWMDALEYLLVDSGLYVPGVFMCGSYGIKAQNEAAETMGLNALRFCIQRHSAQDPSIPHGYDLLPVYYETGPELWLFEPNEGFDYEFLIPLKGPEGYKPDYAFI